MIWPARRMKAGQRSCNWTATIVPLATPAPRNTATQAAQRRASSR